MNLLLIGGTGFMGSALANYLSRDTNNHVVTLSRSDKHLIANHNIHYNVAALGWEMVVNELSLLNQWYVIDLAYASVPNTSFADPIKDFSDNLYMVNKHLENISKLNIQKYIYISSGGTIYGNVASSPINEQCPNFPLSPYGITKMACERYVNLYHHTHGLNMNIVRPANIYGPGQKPFRGQGFVSTALGLAYKGESAQIFGDGSHERDYLFIDDFCNGLKDIIDFGISGEIYNLGSGHGLSINTVVESINELLSKEKLELTKKYLPQRPFDVASNVLDSTKLSKLNGWNPKISFEDGLAITQKWIKQYITESL